MKYTDPTGNFATAAATGISFWAKAGAWIAQTALTVSIKLAENGLGAAIKNYALMGMTKWGSAPNSLKQGFTVYFQQQSDITQQQFADCITYFMGNVQNVWQDMNGVDISKVRFQVADASMTIANLKRGEVLLNIGDMGIIPSNIAANGISGSMNIQMLENTAAHEFGHLVGLQDRYFEGVTYSDTPDFITKENMSIARFSHGWNEAIPRGKEGVRISEDPDYRPWDNLYSTNSSTLTPFQKRMASSGFNERNYRNGRGVLYENPNTSCAKHYFRVSRGSVTSKTYKIGKSLKDLILTNEYTY